MKLILACDPSGGIGYQNKLPWDNLQGDLPRFKQLTDGQVVVMGRNTWDSLPKKPLPNRMNFVVTTNVFEVPYSTFLVNTTEHFRKFKNAWLIGGAQLINSCWNMIDEIHLSRSIAEYTCDTHIDLIKLNEFKLVSEEILSDHTYQIWKRQ